MVCDSKTSGSLEFCRKCYHLYKDDVKEKKSWVRVLKNEAQRERRRKEREVDDVSLDRIMDNQHEKGYV